MTIEVAADPDKPWRLEIFGNDDQIGRETIGSRDRRSISIDLSRFDGQRTNIRLYQQSIDYERRSAYWRNARIE